MGWRIVRQPNGLLGRFSDVVDDFTHVNLTHDEAVELCNQSMFVHDAEAKVKRGEEDWPTWGHEEPHPEKLGRWNRCLNTIMAIHGKHRFYVRRRECTDPPSPATGERGPSGGTDQSRA